MVHILRKEIFDECKEDGSISLNLSELWKFYWDFCSMNMHWPENVRQAKKVVSNVFTLNLFETFGFECFLHSIGIRTSFVSVAWTMGLHYLWFYYTSARNLWRCSKYFHLSDWFSRTYWSISESVQYAPLGDIDQTDKFFLLWFLVKIHSSRHKFGDYFRILIGKLAFLTVF